METQIIPQVLEHSLEQLTRGSIRLRTMGLHAIPPKPKGTIRNHQPIRYCGTRKEIGAI
jgi:nitric oxide synthase oxygenase domain/subunit